MKKTWGEFLPVAVIALIALGLFWWNHREHPKATTGQFQRESTLHALALEHNAFEDWEKSFTNRTSVFTIDLQDTFLNKSKPFEFTGKLEDIRRDGPQIVALFTVDTPPHFSISLRLICSEEQRRILTGKPGSYAIIAEIHKVMKPDGLIAFTAENSDENGIVDQTFDVDWDTDTYWVAGKCVDVRKFNE